MDPVCTCRKKLSVDDGDDRISNLPPELVGKILSLLPTKQAVATSVLSSRWKSFWTLITRLDLETDFDKPSSTSFMYQVLIHLKLKPTVLDYLRLRCPRVDNNATSRVREWLSTALLVDVYELDLSIFWNLGNDYSHTLPFKLFSCKKLLKMTLGGRFTIDIPSTVCLPNLQALVLESVQFRDDSSLKRLLIGCPALEELKVRSFHKTRHFLPQELFSSTKLAKLQLEVCFVMDVPKLVSLPSLEAMHLDGVIFPNDDSVRRLLRGCPSLRILDINIDCVQLLHVDAPGLLDLTVNYSGRGGYSKMVLETPSLHHLKVKGLATYSCELADVNLLVEANLFSVRHNYQLITNLLKGLANVKTLYLSGSVMEGIVNGGCELPKFHNLTTLRLGLSLSVGWDFIPDLLENSPFLETLVFEHGIKEYSNFRKDCATNGTCHAPLKVPYCLNHNLKVIEIRNFGGDIEGERMIRYFIENRGVLNDLTIIQYSSSLLWENRRTVYLRRSVQEAAKKLLNEILG